jgi:hypothetical protein
MKEMNTLRLTTIKALLEAYPPAIATPDHIGQTPLHLACNSSNSSMEVLQLMLQYSSHVEDAFQMQAINGQTPLHCLIVSIMMKMSNADAEMNHVHQRSHAGNHDDESFTDQHYNLVSLVELLLATACPTCVLEMQDRHGKTAADYLVVQRFSRTNKVEGSGADNASRFVELGLELLQKVGSSHHH